jgi:DNA-binding NarL/FixJ family response regulator
MGLRILLVDVNKGSLCGMLARDAYTYKHSTLGMNMKLSKRQREYMRELVKGASNKEIAHTLSVDEGTVKMTLHMLYERFGVSNRTQLAVKFVTVNGGEYASDDRS